MRGSSSCGMPPTMFATYMPAENFAISLVTATSMAGRNLWPLRASRMPKVAKPNRSAMTRATKAPRAPRADRAGGAASLARFGIIPNAATLSADRSAISTVDTTVWPACRQQVATNATPNSSPPRAKRFLAYGSARKTTEPSSVLSSTVVSIVLIIAVRFSAVGRYLGSE